MSTTAPCVVEPLQMIKGLALYYGYAGTMFGVNIRNENGDTTVDISQNRHRDEPSRDLLLIKKILRKSGGSNATKLGFIRNISVRRFYHLFTKKYRKTITTESQNALLVVVALIVTMTFQVAVTPPSGFWQDSIIIHNNNITAPVPPNGPNGTYDNEYYGKHRARDPIMATTRTAFFQVINVVNFLAFMTSVFMIVLRTLNLPIRHILRASLAFLTITYILSLPLRKTVLTVVAIICLVAFFLAVKIGRHASQRVKFVYPDGDEDDKVEMDMVDA